MWFSSETFSQMFTSGMIIDARAGGLVIGRSHDEGDILMVQQTKDGRFFIPGWMEGGEYILNADAYFAAKDHIEKINSYKDNHEIISSIALTPKTRILNTHSEADDKMLWIDVRGQFIVNKRATAKYFQEIEEINEKFSGFLSCNLDHLERKT